MRNDRQATAEIASSTDSSNCSAKDQSGRVWCRATDCRANFEGQERAKVDIFDREQREDLADDGLEGA